jgi:AcrR family transcriptional regulator
VAIPSLYRFFADRDEILDALAEHMTADLDQHARAAEAA